MKKIVFALTLSLVIVVLMNPAMQTVTLVRANFLPAPSIEIISPLTYGWKIYQSSFMMAQIDVRVLKDSPEITSINYSLDEQTSVSLRNFTKSNLGYFGPAGTGFAISAKFILENLSEGNHTLKAYSLDAEGKNMSTSVKFTVEPGYESPRPYDNPRVLLLSPQNQTYFNSEIPLVFVMNGEIKSAYYFLDYNGREPVSIAGNITLTGLSEGTHTIYVSATTGIGGWATQITSFNINSTQADNPLILKNQILPITLVAISITLVAAGLLVYFKKSKRRGL